MVSRWDPHPWVIGSIRVATELTVWAWWRHRRARPTPRSSRRPSSRSPSESRRRAWTLTQWTGLVGVWRSGLIATTPARSAPFSREPACRSSSSRKTAHKLDRLHAIARATLEGELDAQLLLSLPLDQVRERLKRLPGIGDFSADLVLLRGASAPDELPLHEPRLGCAIAVAYDVAQPWRPYRTWCCLLLRAWLEGETHEIAG